MKLKTFTVTYVNAVQTGMNPIAT